MTESTQKILLVDDEERLLDSISRRISLLGHTPLKATSGLQAIEIAKQTDVDLAIVDLNMPDMDGLVTITKLKEIIPDLKTILLTGYGSEKTKQATQALGAIYVEKDAMGGLWDIVRQSVNKGNVIVIKPPSHAGQTTAGDGASGQIEIYDELSYPPAHKQKASAFADERGQHPVTLPKIIAQTPEMQRLKKNIRRFSEMDCAIAIKGEIGTGKELAARTIHSLSRRKHQKFLAFDCGCFSNDFQFSELVTFFDETLGRKNSEGDLSVNKDILFSGTILLDHIENMPKQIQEEMMNLLEGTLPSPKVLTDIRFIVVAHKSLEERVSNGTFQKELYRRIQAIELRVPPLRQRTEDLPLLCRYFLNQFNRELGKKIKTISQEVLQIFNTYAFPGNVRELKDIIESAVMSASGDIILPAHLPERLTAARPETPPEDSASFPTIQQMEQKHILKAISITGGNKSKAAEILGISRAALWRKLRLMAQESQSR